ncbi:hypothetical protein F5146DRAFT_998608 [Armillaria mellea]|nr:hypothetical protein F5146DRAFT_998608 [Armillaria mellea]
MTKRSLTRMRSTQKHSVSIMNCWAHQCTQIVTLPPGDFKVHAPFFLTRVDRKQGVMLESLKVGEQDYLGKGVRPSYVGCEASNIFRFRVGNTKKLLPKKSPSVETRGTFSNAFKMPAAPGAALAYGMSALTSVVHAILTLINDAHIADTLDSSTLCHGRQSRVYGTPEFDSVPGWDPMTGLGTSKIELRFLVNHISRSFDAVTKQCTFTTPKNGGPCRELSASIGVKPNGLEYTGELAGRSLAILTSTSLKALQPTHTYQVTMVGAMLPLMMVVVPTSGVATNFGLRLNELPGRITERQEKSKKVYVALTSCHPRSIESDTNFPPAYDSF